MNKLISLAFAMIFQISIFIGWCITWYAESYAAFFGGAVL